MRLLLRSTNYEAGTAGRKSIAEDTIFQFADMHIIDGRSTVRQAEDPARN